MCSRLEDHYTVSTAALPGIQSLLSKHLAFAIQQGDHSDLPKECTLDLIKSILREIHVQSMVQSDRLIIFNICHFVLCSQIHTEIILNEKFDTDFVYGFIQAMDGEKDPRNLVICFECIQMICHKFRLGPFVEETFEVFSCYFPIDFTPVNSQNLNFTEKLTLIILILKNFLLIKSQKMKVY